MDIIKKIKETREAKGVSRYKLSQLTGIHESTLKRYEDRAIKKISFENLLKICEALEINIKEII